MVREFPENRRRYTIEVRAKTSLLRYVVLEDFNTQSNYRRKPRWVQEWMVMEKDL
jgi:hypothetical protein